ncbi:MAG: DUF2802 domain-containing protein [Rhodocyclaceae bacterium]|jgi:DNA-directed RNA polymerase specialized sigma24 family protein|nr:DUF2802 domain-containing protein [Rhodocyclaceae bacterium]
MEAELIGIREVLLLVVGVILGALVSALFRRWRAGKAGKARHDRTSDPAAAGNGQEAASVAAFGQQLAEHLARYDLEREVGKLREEVAQLREEVKELRAARNISPQYAEALGLAQRGMSAQEIADRLGISLAEAELVHALSRGEELFKEPALDDGVWQPDRPPV